jgi:hypothetical protein
MITPDTKDWTWVLETPCADCGYDAATVDPASVAARTRAAIPRWREVLGRHDVRQRPTPQVWSPLEYSCHVRDVLVLFDQRLELMLTVDGAQFANWDQDVTAVQENYGAQDPAAVSPALASAGAAIADRFDTVEAGAWERTALRSDGAVFTTVSFSRYFLHDIEHHLHDVDA